MSLQFCGPTQIYLQGKAVLQPIDWQNDDFITYFLGDEQSRITITDHRPFVNRQAQFAIQGMGQADFLNVFCQPALVTIDSDGQETNVVIEDTDDFVAKEPILWMGVLEDNLLPANPLTWLHFEETKDHRIAFVGLVDSFNQRGFEQR
ncbi:MAG: hypothetical protein LDL12_02735 [Anaerolinea sp.]|nr:hypothetical protein [Anaerolinea sp.]